MCIVCFDLDCLQKLDPKKDSNHILALINKKRPEFNIYNCSKLKDLVCLIYFTVLKNNKPVRLYSTNYRNITKLSLTNLVNLNKLPEELTNINDLLVYDVPKVTYIPETYKNLKKLTIINSEISNLSESYVKLETLYLQNTQITKLSKKYINLRHLELNMVPIDKLEYYPNLYHLLLFKTDITVIPFDYKYNLTELNLSASINYKLDSHIKVLPRYLTSLKKLYISLTDIQKVPDTYTELTDLYLYQSAVKELSPNFSKLEYLDCSCTEIKYIPKEYVNLTELVYDPEVTFWDDSWYKTEEEIEQIKKIQRCFLTKRYINHIIFIHKRSILDDYRNYIREKYSKRIIYWYLKIKKHQFQTQYFKTNKTEILNEYKLWFKNKSNNATKIQCFIKSIIKLQNYINYIKQNHDYYLSLYKTWYKLRRSNILILQKWYKKLRYIRNLCTKIEKNKNSYLRSYKYYLRQKQHISNSITPNIYKKFDYKFLSSLSDTSSDVSSEDLSNSSEDLNSSSEITTDSGLSTDNTSTTTLDLPDEILEALAALEDNSTNENSLASISELTTELTDTNLGYINLSSKNLAKLLYKVYKRYKRKKSTENMNEYYLFKQSDNTYKLSKNKSKSKYNYKYLTVIKTTEEFTKFKQKIKNLGLKMRYNSITSNSYNLIDILTQTSTLHF